MADYNLISYIKASQQQGRTKPDIEKALLSNGWRQEAINEAFSVTEVRTAQPTATKSRYIYFLIGGGIICFIILIFIHHLKVMKK